MSLLLSAALAAGLAGMAPDGATPHVHAAEPPLILATGSGGKMSGGFGKWRKGDLKRDFDGAVNPRPPSGPKGGHKSGTADTSGKANPVLRPRGPIFRPGGI